MTTYVFTGPTMTAGVVARAVPGVVCRPPVSRGDVYRAVRAGATTVAIIDGYFDRVPSVWHKEILWALSRGVRVLGAGSMGALRAAELSPFGMIGVGSVYQDFVDGVLTDDDEVAVLHAPAELDYAPLSTAMVNIRVTLEAARSADIIDDSMWTFLLSVAKRTYYKERSYDALTIEALRVGHSADEIERLSEWLIDHQIDQKALDAGELIRQLRSPNWPSHGAPRFVNTIYWSRLMDSVPSGWEDASSTIEVVREIGLRGPSFQHLLQGAERRVLAAREARRLGIHSSSAFEQARARIFEVHGITSDGARARWMAVNGIASQRDLDSMIGKEADGMLVCAVLMEEVRQALLENLKLMGLYGPLVARLKDKRAVLAAAMLTDKSDAELIRWHFSLARASPPADISGYAQTCGFRTEEEFVDALREEYTYAEARRIN